MSSASPVTYALAPPASVIARMPYWYVVTRVPSVVANGHEEQPVGVLSLDKDGSAYAERDLRRPHEILDVAAGFFGRERHLRDGFHGVPGVVLKPGPSHRRVGSEDLGHRTSPPIERLAPITAPRTPVGERSRPAGQGSFVTGSVQEH